MVHTSPMILPRKFMAYHWNGGICRAVPMSKRRGCERHRAGHGSRRPVPTAVPGDVVSLRKENRW